MIPGLQNKWDITVNPCDPALQARGRIRPVRGAGPTTKKLSGAKHTLEEHTAPPPAASGRSTLEGWRRLGSRSGRPRSRRAARASRSRPGRVWRCPLGTPNARTRRTGGCGRSDRPAAGPLEQRIGRETHRLTVDLLLARQLDEHAAHSRCVKIRAGHVNRHELHLGRVLG